MISKKIVIASALVGVLAFGGDQFAMSDSDRAMYAEMLENNPADIMIASGEESLAEFCGSFLLISRVFHVIFKSLVWL